jgi:beta-lactamase superfamily II metal-dependent hydrolase
MRILHLAITALLLASPLAAQAPARETLDIYFVDTEGGQATLFVAPSGESVLVDTGNPGSRDTDRILATVREAGVERIDHLLITHYHGDHHGGVAELARRIPIAHFVDHGPTVETNAQGLAFQEVYRQLTAAARHTVVKPGDRLEIPGLDWQIVSAAGAVLSSPRPGAGQANAGCPSERPAANPADENGQSTGSFVTFGEFSTIDLGDLLIPQELDLVCPVNRLGTVDLYITSHHGLATSGSAALVHALRPRVTVMNNGTRKGGSVQAFEILHRSPGLEDLWQLHWSHNAGVELNAPGIFIANIDEPAALAAVIAPAGAAGQGGPGAGGRPTPHDGLAYSIRVSARRDGSFTVTNGRNGFSREYPPAR